MIVRLQNKDKSKRKNKKDQSSSPNKVISTSRKLSIPKHLSPSKPSKPESTQSLSARNPLKGQKLSFNQELKSSVHNPVNMARTETQTPLQNLTNPPSDSNGNHQNTEDTAPFRPHMTLEQAFKLKVHDKIDHRDQVGRFLFATVIEKKHTNLKIHYDGWNRKWDTWSDFNAEIHRFAVAGSISRRRAHRFEHFKEGDYIDINPQRNPGWKCGEIRKLDQKSGQVQVVFESMDKYYLYWAHLDNEAEIAEFTSKSGTVHATSVDIVENEDSARDDALHHRSRYRMSAKRFPRVPNKRIANKYETGYRGASQETQVFIL